MKTSRTLTDEELCMTHMALEFWIEHCEMAGSWVCDPQKMMAFNDDLSALLLKDKSERSAWKRAKKQLDLTPEGIAKSENLAAREAQSGS